MAPVLEGNYLRPDPQRNWVNLMARKDDAFVASMRPKLELKTKRRRKRR